MHSHIPVLLHEIIKTLDIREGTQYIDATVGMGGHTRAILERGGNVLGIDRDPESIEYVQKELGSHYPAKLILETGSFSQIKSIAQKHNIESVSGIIFDFGLSSWQLDSSERGLSYLRDEPLDMRFDKTEKTVLASDVLNQMTTEQLTDIFEKYGEEPKAPRIAAILVRSRPLKSTGQVRKILEDHGIGNFQTFARVFQAVRIEVNKELEHIKIALPQAAGLLRSGGKLAIISFHSLEDRIVKRFLISQKNTMNILTKQPIIASTEEQQENPRSKSAKLRIAEKI